VQMSKGGSVEGVQQPFLTRCPQEAEMVLILTPILSDPLYLLHLHFHFHSHSLPTRHVPLASEASAATRSASGCAYARMAAKCQL